MIRVLAIISVVGFLVFIVCIGGAIGLGGRALTRGDGKWVMPEWLDHVQTTAGPVVEVDGSGPTETRKFAWSGDDKLTVDSPSEVTYTQGPDASVTVTGPSSVVDHIEVNDGEIRLQGITSRNIRGGGHITIEVQAPKVSHFEFNGAQKVDLRSYDQDELGLEVNGAGDVRGAGRAKSLTLELNGASKADFTDLALAEAHIQMNGASNVTAGPTDLADIEINGVGSANLLGRPKSLTERRHGIGSVNVRDRPATAPAPKADADKSSQKGDAGKKKT